MNRLYNLDYLRGLAALGIMIYHYCFFIFGAFAADTILGRVGVYGVSIFYVLSGLTLYHVYHSKMHPTLKDVGAFFRKRFFRIFPLLWLATIAAIILSKQVPDAWKVILNLTGLFGFFRWDGYFATGAWSIGNELVFYVFFPFFILFSKRFTSLFVILSTIIFGLYMYFAFHVLDGKSPLDKQWHNYVNPLNQVFLFLGGYTIGLVFEKRQFNHYLNVLLLVVAILIFVFYPAYGNAISIVTGVSRLVFTSCCFIVCLSFYKLEFKLPDLFNRPLTFLGEASYSVYLLHPLVFSFVRISFDFLDKCDIHIHSIFKLLLSIAITLVFSYFVYEHFEKFFMKVGKGKK